MVDYVLRPLAGLLLCLAIGAVILCLPYVIRIVTARVSELREARNADVRPEEPPAEDVPEEPREESTVNTPKRASDEKSKSPRKDSAA
jgi:hypothetical protein